MSAVLGPESSDAARTPALFGKRERAEDDHFLSRSRERAGARVRAWLGVAIALAVVVMVVPVLHLAVAPSSAFHLSDYAVSLIGKIMCYAICALAMDLIWGYTGILSLGHGVFFALGGPERLSPHSAWAPSTSSSRAWRAQCWPRSPCL